MKIISRKEERKELEYSERSKKSELICVYGRRRAGKTFLVEQTFRDFAFRAVGLENGTAKHGTIRGIPFDPNIILIEW